MKLLAKPWPNYFWISCFFVLLSIICLTNYSQGYKILENDFHTGKMWNCWRSPRQIIFVFPVFLLLRIISLTNYYQGSKCSKIIFTQVKCENVGQSSPFSWGGGFAIFGVLSQFWNKFVKIVIIFKKDFAYFNEFTCPSK